MPRNHTALVLVEGETEEIFYKRIADNMLTGIPKQIRNMKGNYNINNKIIDKCNQFSILHPQTTFDVYICVDQERIGMPVYNNVHVEEKLNLVRGLEQKIDVIANLMIESLFFIDIQGIYKHLRTPAKQRNASKFSNFRKLTHRDLTRLFESHGKQYYKGHRCQSLVNSLDLNLIINGAPELNLLVRSIRTRHAECN